MLPAPARSRMRALLVQARGEDAPTPYGSQPKFPLPANWQFPGLPASFERVSTGGTDPDALARADLEYAVRQNPVHCHTRPAGVSLLRAGALPRENLPPR